MPNLRRLTPIKLADLIESLAEHAIDTGLKPQEVTDVFRKRYYEIILDLYGGNQSHASRAIGMHRNTIRTAMNRLRIERKGYTMKYGVDGKYEF